MSTTAQRVPRENEERVVGSEAFFFLLCFYVFFFTRAQRVRHDKEEQVGGSEPGRPGRLDGGAWSEGGVREGGGRGQGVGSAEAGRPGRLEGRVHAAAVGAQEGGRGTLGLERGGKGGGGTPGRGREFGVSGGGRGSLGAGHGEGGGEEGGRRRVHGGRGGGRGGGGLWAYGDSREIVEGKQIAAEVLASECIPLNLCYYCSVSPYTSPYLSA
jgi:hypothetical protein